MNFLARAVHDFRTPLTAVNGYCGMMLSGQLGPLTLEQQEVLGRTLHSIRRLGRLATALFQWSSGVRVGLRPQIREADIEECCRQAFHEIQPLANEKNIAVEMDYTRAILQFRNAIQTMPGDAKPLLSARPDLSAAGNPSPAAGCFRRASINPRHAAAQPEMADLLATATTHPRSPMHNGARRKWIEECRRLEHPRPYRNAARQTGRGGRPFRTGAQSPSGGLTSAALMMRTKLAEGDVKARSCSNVTGRRPGQPRWHW